MSQHREPDDEPAPLRSLRVIDTADAPAEMCARYLADLGAEVVRVEPPGGSASRTAWPRWNGIGLREATRAAGKLGVLLDPADGRDRTDFLRLLCTADIWITTATAEQLDRIGIDEIRRRAPHLVIASVTDFGLTGPYRDYAATEWVHAAMSGLLCRSGIPGRRPLLPPREILEQAAAAQAAWCALLAHFRRLRTGGGDHLDISLHETLTQVIDPPFGAGPTAGYGRSWWDFPHDRPDAGSYYPVLPCADGHVRICVLSKAQWTAMRAWLGEPVEFQAPEYELIIERQKADARLRELIGALFADRSKEDLAVEGQRRGIPVAPVLDLREVLDTEHFAERGCLRPVDLGARTGRMPGCSVQIDGHRPATAARAPELGEHTEQVLSGLPPLPPLRSAGEDAPAAVPFAGLRVLDLGVIVVGAEAGRMFADYGADVVKVEHSTHPDGSRAPFDGTVSSGFAWGHRGKRSLAVDLRDPRGHEIVERLAATADVLLSNFKPGTLDRLGLDEDRLRSLNPGLVIVRSSAVGHTGPWRGWMGYGPLIRAATGLTALWRDPEIPDGFCDAVTVYPDHLVGRLVATAALAVLVERENTGRGRAVTCAQSEAILEGLSAQLLRESLEPGSAQPHGGVAEEEAPCGAYPCAGDDEWCVITVRGDADYERLRKVVELPDVPDRVAHRDRIDARLAAWTARRSPQQVMHELQAAGVPAGAMNRIPDCAADPALRERRAFTTVHQPTVEAPLPTENGQFLAERTAARPPRPAPVHGQHTREVCTGTLGMSEHAVDELAAAGVLEEPDPFGPVRGGRPGP
ncbi:CoA transferase [Saccharopolyspora sp. HNM0983]|uniref:CoA transferase n=1 Tax=Saccharopolyspora montiporae TaxID=2781240 RepID=A0A929B7E3_9PSEU|nr:CoA transferase [Saccharopolyspora sp. HNM0983]MBE9374609.1 CoA transferase [Saccharopolyspora sp. HNM0983]